MLLELKPVLRQLPDRLRLLNEIRSQGVEDVQHDESGGLGLRGRPRRLFGATQGFCSRAHQQRSSPDTVAVSCEVAEPERGSDGVLLVTMWLGRRLISSRTGSTEGVLVPNSSAQAKTTTRRHQRSPRERSTNGQSTRFWVASGDDAGHGVTLASPDVTVDDGVWCQLEVAVDPHHGVTTAIERGRDRSRHHAEHVPRSDLEHVAASAESRGKSKTDIATSNVGQQPLATCQQLEPCRRGGARRESKREDPSPRLQRGDLDGSLHRNQVDSAVLAPGSPAVEETIRAPRRWQSELTSLPESV